MDLSDAEQLEYVSKQKSVICQEIGVDVFIDDSLDHALDCSSLGIQVLLFDYYGNYYWNHSHHPITTTKSLTSCSQLLYKRELNNVTRVHHWRDIMAQFPKPSSPLKYCCYSMDYYDEEEEESSNTSQDEIFDNPSNYYTYETIEVEESSEDEIWV